MDQNIPLPRNAECWAYDIRDVLDTVREAFDQIAVTLHKLPECFQNPTKEELIDRWIDHTLTAGRVVEAVGHRYSPWEQVYTQLEQLATDTIYRQLDHAASLLWRTVEIPWYCSGCQFIKHRERNVLWVAYLDPQAHTYPSRL